MITGGNTAFKPHCIECAKPLPHTGAISVKIKYIHKAGEGETLIQDTLFWCSERCLTRGRNRCKGNFARVN